MTRRYYAPTEKYTPSCDGHVELCREIMEVAAHADPLGKRETTIHRLNIELLDLHRANNPHIAPGDLFRADRTSQNLRAQL